MSIDQSSIQTYLSFKLSGEVSAIISLSVEEIIDFKEHTTETITKESVQLTNY